MTTISPTSLPGLYAALMEEVKERRDAASKTLARAHNDDPPYSYLDIEFCYLQVRRICEALALAVLVAHNDLDGFRSKDLMKEYKADALFSDLTKLNSTAFPRCARFAPDQEPGMFVATIANEGLLTKEGLAKIYHTCADGLHAGSLRRMLNHGPKRYNVSDVVSWLNQIVRLLDVHVVVLPDGRMMTVEMTGGANGAVICHMDFLVEG